MKDFEYASPQSLNEAIALMTQYGSDGAILAGGTDLVVQMKQGSKAPKCVINTKGIGELDDITYSEDQGMSIGPLVTHNSLASNPIVQERYGLLGQAASSVGTFQIRERGTIGGNICNASPAADTIAPLICLKAMLRLNGLKRERVVAIEDFFVGPQKTKREADEILSRIELAPLPVRTGGVYLKLGVRKALEIAIVGVAALLTLEKNSRRCKEARIALASVAPVPLLCKKAAEVMIGKNVKEDIIDKVARVAQTETQPISDVRGSAQYRTEMSYVLTKRALQAALEQAIA